VYVQPEQGAADDVGKPGGEALAVTPPLPPAGDHVVALVELVEQQRDVDLRVGLQVGGEEHDHVATGLAEAAVERLGQAQVAALAHQPDARLDLGGGRHHGGGVVGGAVVDVDQFPRPADLGERLGGALHEDADGGLLVVRRHHHADQSVGRLLVLHARPGPLLLDAVHLHGSYPAPRACQPAHPDPAK
jgi:hypothetical protein